MRKYEKPSLTRLGLLRAVTKFSTCPRGEVDIEGKCYTIG